jgi:hypothetical protein
MRFKGYALSTIFFCAVCFYSFGSDVAVEEAEQDKTAKTTVPLSFVFHNVGLNVLRSIAYNCGLNFIGTGLETWASIETGLDWKWRNIAYDNV